MTREVAEAGRQGGRRGGRRGAGVRRPSTRSQEQRPPTRVEIAASAKTIQQRLNPPQRAWTYIITIIQP